VGTFDDDVVLVHANDVHKLAIAKKKKELRLILTS